MHLIGVFAVFALLIAGCSAGAVGSARQPISAATAASPCTMSVQDSRWLESAIDAWNVTRRRFLHLSDDDPPTLILFDDRCTFRVDGFGGTLDGHAHGGAVRLPNGRDMPPFAIAFASPIAGDSAIFLAIALPAVWREDRRYSGSRENWHQFLTGVFLHEMTHVRMLDAFLPRLRMLEVEIYPDSIEDDAVQNRFGGDAAFTASVRRETDMLIRAGRAATRSQQLDLAGRALALMRERRDRYYVGDDAFWTEMEQIFLDLEGAGQWAAFMHARSTFYRHMRYDQALARFRSGEQYWSQDQGLALYLALDAIVPGWQSRVFAPEPASSVDLLAEAVGRSLRP